MARLNIVKPRSNDYAVIASQLYHTLGAHAMGQDRTLAMMIIHGFMLCPCCTNIYIYYKYIHILLAYILVYNTFGWFCREKKHDALCIAYFSYFFMCYLFGRCRWACELMNSWLNSLIFDLLGHHIVQRPPLPFMTAEIKHQLHQIHGLEQASSSAAWSRWEGNS